MKKHGWIDSHAHLVSEQLVDDFPDIRKNAQEQGITKICIICGSVSEIEQAMLLCEHDELFDLAIGIHPSDSQKVSDKELNRIESYLSAPNVVAVGEIGLDYYWDTSFNEVQKEILIHQIGWANQYRLPICVHMRNSYADIRDILQRVPADRCGVLHCFSEGQQQAQEALAMGYHLGFGGVITFKNAQSLRDVVSATPIDRMLSETDSPYLTPHPYRGKTNQPAYVRYVGEAIAAIKNISHETAQAQLAKNYLALFGRR